MPLGRPLVSSSGPLACGQNDMYGSIAGFRLATGTYTPDAFGKSPWRACASGTTLTLLSVSRLPEAFVVAEEEQPVLLQRAAQRAAELILPEGRRERGLVEEVARIQGAVAQKFEQACRAARWCRIASPR